MLKILAISTIQVALRPERVNSDP